MVVISNEKIRQISILFYPVLKAPFLRSIKEKPKKSPVRSCLAGNKAPNLPYLAWEKEKAPILSPYLSLRSMKESIIPYSNRLKLVTLRLNMILIWQQVEEEQNGKERAEYGTELIKQLSQKFTKKHGRGFTETNLKYMRQFYRSFEKSHSLRDELSWTHYRLLLKQARLF